MSTEDRSTAGQRPAGARRPAPHRIAAVAAAAAVASTVSLLVAAPQAGAATTNLVVNPTMERSTSGWFASSSFALARVAGGHGGGYAVRLRNSATTARTGVVNDTVNTVRSTTAGHVYAASAWVRSSTPRRTVSLRLMEYRGRTYLGQKVGSVTLPDTGWHKVSTVYTARTTGATVDVNVLGVRLPAGASVLVDDVTLRDATPAGPPPTDPGTPDDPTGTTRAGWTLKWADEFDGTGVDATRWKVDDLSTYGDGNSELACLMDRPENVFTSGGVLTIRARREAAPVRCGDRDARFPAGRSYTSGMLRTTAAWQYGRIEMRAQLPTAQGVSKGLWPGFWMRPAGGGTGELDILETIGSGPGGTEWNKIHQTIWYDYSGTHPRQTLTATTDVDPSAGFHTYAAEWEPGVIRWYVDDRLTYTRTTATTPWLDEAFGKPFVIRLNMAVGGSWPGSPDATTTFPAEYRVDHVRVYQR